MSSNSCGSRVPSPDTDASHDLSPHDHRRPPTPERVAGRAAVIAHLAVPLSAAPNDDASKRGDASNDSDAARAEAAGRADAAAHTDAAANAEATSHGDVLVLTVAAVPIDPSAGAALAGDRPAGKAPNAVASLTGDAPDGDASEDNEVDGDDAREAARGLDDGGVESAIIHRLDAAVEALDEVDFARWSDAALSGHLDEVSLVLCRVDAQLSRLADAVRSRGFAIAEVDLPLAS